MRARRVDALGAGVEHLGDDRLGVAALHLRHARAHGVAGQAAPDEDDEAVEPRDAVPAERERVDRELELLASLDGGGHASRLAGHGGQLSTPGSHAANQVRPWNAEPPPRPEPQNSRTWFAPRARFVRGTTLRERADVDRARSRPVELAEEDPLLRPSASSPSRERDQHLRPHQGGADVRRRVLLGLLVCCQPQSSRDDLLQRPLEVAATSRVGVLVDRQPAVVCGT